MSRYRLLPVILLALLTHGLAQRSDSVQVALTLKDGKTSYRMGEAIVLDLSFVANGPGHAIDSTTTEPASPIDEIVILPVDGIFPWLEDLSRGHRYAPDYSTGEELSPGTPSHILVPLNAVYRIDKPGRYSVHVITHRLQSGDGVSSKPVPPTGPGEATGVKTNEVSFDVEAMSEADEQVIVDKLVGEIRPLAKKLLPILVAVGTGNTKGMTEDQRRDLHQDWERANDLVKELSWLSGDPSTRAKLDLYLHPEVFGPFSAEAAQGLWIARNRRLVVTLLEQAMKDSPEAVRIASVTAGMKATIAGRSLDDTVQIQRQLEVEHLREIAKTLTERTGENLIETTTTLFMQLAQAKQTETPEFAAVRQSLITHFGEVSPWHLDVLLNTYGEYLHDPRLVLDLEAFLREHQPPILSGARNAVFKQLLTLASPQDVRPFVTASACDPESHMSFVLVKLPWATLPEADQCLLKQIQQLGASDERSAQFELSQKTALAGRFATQAIYQPMLAVYKQYGSKWLDDARGGMLAYLARYDEKSGLELLRQGIKLGTGQPTNATMSLCESFYSPTVNRFFEEQLQREDDTEAVSWAAAELSRYGPAGDEAVIRARLDRWHKKWSAHGEELDLQQGRLEGDLILALIHATNWQMDEAEARRLKESCVSDGCRDRVKRFGDLPQSPP